MARPAPAKDTRTRLVEHARDLYLEGGMAAFSMRRVAERAKLTATAIYRHFDTKEALLGAVCEQGFERFAEALWRALREASPRARLEAATVQYRKFALDNPGFYRVMFMASSQDFGFHELPEANQEKLGPTFQFLVDRVRECCDAKVLRAGDPKAISFTIWSHLHGQVSLYLTGTLGAIVPDDAAFVAVYDASVKRLLTGLLTP
jgi:AcrR family transcriptional regulator